MKYVVHVLLLICAASCTSVFAQSPSIAILIVEKVRGYGSGFEQPGHSESILARELISLGLKVIDAETVRNNLTRQRAELLLQGDDDAARKVALLHDAEYMIFGSANSKPAGAELFNTQMKSIQASINVKLIRTSDGAILDTADATAAKVHLDELQGGLLAIEAASAKISNSLNDSLEQIKLGSIEGAFGENSVHISGLVSYQHLDFVMTFIELDVIGVDELSLVSFSDGVAELAIQGTVATDALAMSLARKRFKSFKITPFKVAGSRIDARIKMK